ncbi:MFS transporter [Piscirickettsia litoralis]|uniref:Lysosomal dipeptide transporter MFSD1 n=1 Tax=Piscirickettsia litoralis TaxID=1891921 RepID=A0ABX3A2F8_9GAMM|nr:MFS transporter [Piscirickettsia litoralis]ODN42690.1 MFS transporter [Piscirickettsia litoralis]
MQLIYKRTLNLTLIKPYLFFILAASFLLYEMAVQVSTSVITKELMSAFAINATGVGLLSSFYYYSYAAMQIPAGLAFDRLNARILITISLGICAIGTLLFSLTDSFTLAALGRFFTGFGSAFAFIAMLFIAAQWFPTRYFGLIAGIGQFLAAIGALAGQGPLAAIVSNIGWREALKGLGIIGIILAVIILLILKDKRHHHNQPSIKSKHNSNNTKSRLSIKNQLSLLFKHPETFKIALYSFAAWAPITIFASLWGVPFLHAHYNISTNNAANLSSMIWLGIAIGSPLIGYWSDKIRQRKPLLLFSAVLGIISSIVVLYSPTLPLIFLYVLMFIFGVGAAGQSLSFAYIKDYQQDNILGTAIGFNNMAVVVSGALFQPLVGFIMSKLWDGKVAGNTPIYSSLNYQTALIIVPLMFIVAALTARFWLKEQEK